VRQITAIGFVHPCGGDLSRAGWRSLVEWFDESGRWLGVYVGVGPEASAEDVDLAFDVANTIRRVQ
jgi:hypothetical protein